jgi:hypothetical protein
LPTNCLKANQEEICKDHTEGIEVEVKQLPDGTATHSSAALAVDEFGLAAAVLPGSRSAIVGTSATGFTTQINNSKGAAYRGPPLSSQSIPERPLSVLNLPFVGFPRMEEVGRKLSFAFRRKP